MASTSIDAGATRISAADRLRLRLSGIAWFVLFTAFLLSLPILFGAWIWIPPLVVILSLLLAFPVAWMARRLFSGQRRHRKSISFLKAAAGTLFLLSALLAAPVYYFAFNTALHPLTVPQATLSNGTRTVIFQGMVHDGSEDFYKSVIYDIEKAISDGDVIYYEASSTTPRGMPGSPRPLPVAAISAPITQPWATPVACRSSSIISSSCVPTEPPISSSTSMPM